MLTVLNQSLPQFSAQTRQKTPLPSFGFTLCGYGWFFHFYVKHYPKPICHLSGTNLHEPTREMHFQLWGKKRKIIRTKGCKELSALCNCLPFKANTH